MVSRWAASNCWRFRDRFSRRISAAGDAAVLTEATNSPSIAIVAKKVLAMKISTWASTSGMLLLAVACVIGCSGTSSEHGHVTGTVTINGSPIQDATVTFAPAGGGRSAIATTQADGTYELNYTPGVKGAKIGSNTVRITTYSAPELDDNNRVVNPGKPERFPPDYSGGKVITVDVKPGENTFDFTIEADKDKYPPPRES